MTAPLRSTAAGFDGSSCDRGGAAKRVLILLTDGLPNTGSARCPAGYGDYWEGLSGNENGNFQCTMWYAQQAAARGVIVYTIGMGDGANRDFLETMATGVDPRIGDGLGPVAWVLPADWPEGFYNLSSHPATDPRDLSNTNQIALLAGIQIKNPRLYLPMILK